MIGAIRFGLAGGAALIALSQLGAAQAQVQSPGWFGSLTGWYYFDSGNRHTTDIGAFGGVPDIGTQHPEDGWGGRAYLGYRFMGAYDVAIGFQGSLLSQGRDTAISLPVTTFLREDARYWAVDGEVGYNLPAGTDTGVRLFAGARYADWNHHLRTRTFDTGVLVVGRNRNADVWGIGPRIGVDLTTRLGGSFSLFVDAAGSVLFGRLHERTKNIVDGTTTINDSSRNVAWNLEGQAGVQYQIAPQVNLGVGYRFEAWWGVSDKTVFTADSKGNINRLMHGPFVRLAYNLGVPAAMPVANPPINGIRNSYIVFFDFDRSNLTPTALGTIKQAADAAKAGKSARVNVTGHADKSGGDQYNMALSLRRANAVKDQLVKEGVPAASIVVVGRGESQPMVPTGDGIKEPQNRRVEIVLQ